MIWVRLLGATYCHGLRVRLIVGRLSIEIKAKALSFVADVGVGVRDDRIDRRSALGKRGRR